MFPPWKLIFQKNNLKYVLFISIASLFVLLALMFNSCPVNFILISNEINSYEYSLDPEFCENILEKIDVYNDQCSPYIEILDCG